VTDNRESSPSGQPDLDARARITHPPAYSAAHHAAKYSRTTDVLRKGEIRQLWLKGCRGFDAGSVWGVYSMGLDASEIWLDHLCGLYRTEVWLDCLWGSAWVFWDTLEGWQPLCKVLEFSNFFRFECTGVQ
jgi:hypothetical protein